MSFDLQVSSPLLRNVQFKYQDDEILANSLTSTNFHTYYQGSEMVVAGRLTTHDFQSDSPPTHTNDLIEYEILATQAIGGYQIDGQYNTSSKVSFALILKKYWVRAHFRCAAVFFCEMNSDE